MSAPARSGPRAPARLVAAFVVALASGGALADDDDDALGLADRTPVAAAKEGAWRTFVELAGTQVAGRSGTAGWQGRRASLDARADLPVSAGLRLVFADRLDASARNDGSADRAIHTLKELYLAWQAAPDRLLDVGRVNARLGVATGYNPTDFFKAGAVRSLVSADPASLRENRLGTAMVRAQALWAGGSATALYAPRLARAPSDSDLSIDLGATNSRARWLVAVTHELAPGVSPQWLLQGGSGQSVQAGFNLAVLANASTVAFVEAAAGRIAPLTAATLGTGEPSWRSRMAAGLTHTTPWNLSLTLEAQYDGAAPDRADWDAIGRAPPWAALQVVGAAAKAQDPANRHGLFAYALWQDAGLRHFDLAAMLRADLDRASRSAWLEARYHADRADFALQWKVDSGSPLSAYGALPQRASVQAIVRGWF